MTRLRSVPLAVLRRVAFALAVAVVLWSAGLIWFATPPAAEHGRETTDAIVVLTGGSQRLQSGLRLLGEGRGRALFVSGVNRAVTLDQLLHLEKGAPAWAACCVVLGYEADDTRGNARETARWMRQQGYRSLRLVTAWYHMRRSLLEFARAMPGIRVVPHPVFPAELAHGSWSARRRTALLVVGEYVKYLAALGRPVADRLLSRGAAAAAMRARQ